jgi:hypothetical protein
MNGFGSSRSCSPVDFGNEWPDVDESEFSEWLGDGDGVLEAEFSLPVESAELVVFVVGGELRLLARSRSRCCFCSWLSFRRCHCSLLIRLQNHETLDSNSYSIR